jgi:hypothetical protein
MEPGLMKHVVGHELGHAWHHPIPTSYLNRHGATWNALECEADAKAIDWGFDMNWLRQWSNQNRRKIWELTGQVGDPPNDAFLLDCTRGLRQA